MLSTEYRVTQAAWIQRLAEAGAIDDCTNAQFEVAEMKAFDDYANELKKELFAQGCMVETICFDADEDTNDHIAIVSYLPIA